MIQKRKIKGNLLISRFLYFEIWMRQSGAIIFFIKKILGKILTSTSFKLHKIVGKN
jgi:hypothetical protein